MQKQEIVKCVHLLKRKVSSDPTATRESVAEYLSGKCALDDAQVDRVISTQFADSGEYTSNYRLPIGYLRESADMQQFKYDAFWRGMIGVGIVLVILGSVLCTVFKPKPWLVALLIVVVVVFGSLGVWRMFKAHGLAGLGQKTSYLTEPTAQAEPYFYTESQ